MAQVVDAYFSLRRNARAAEISFQPAINEMGVRPERVTTDKANCYPPALCTALPGVEHRTSAERLGRETQVCMLDPIQC